jgi:hypothetical protein
MNKLRKWARISEIAGAIAVVLSLLYVGYELRQSTNVALLESSQRLYELAVEVSSWENDLHVAEAVVAAQSDYDALTDIQKHLLQNLVWQQINIWEQAYLSYQSGLLIERDWQAWNASFCSSPRYWEDVISEWIRPEAFIPEFYSIVTGCFEAESSDNVGAGN